MSLDNGDLVSKINTKLPWLYKPGGAREELSTCYTSYLPINVKDELESFSSDSYERSFSSKTNWNAPTIERSDKEANFVLNENVSSESLPCDTSYLPINVKDELESSSSDYFQQSFCSYTKWNALTNKSIDKEASLAVLNENNSPSFKDIKPDSNTNSRYSIYQTQSTIFT